MILPSNTVNAFFINSFSALPSSLALYMFLVATKGIFRVLKVFLLLFHHEGWMYLVLT